jgi:PAS domain S-box-containing protein
MQPIFNDYFSRIKFSENENLKTFRILFILAFSIIVLSGIIYSQIENVIDPLSLRITASALCILALVSSFLIDYVKKNIVYTGYLLAGILIIWVIFITSLNHFNANFAIALMMSFLAASVLFNKVSHLLFYYLFANCCIEIACVTTPNMQVNGLLYMVYTAGSSLIFFTVLKKSIQTNEQLIFNKEYLTSIFHNSPDGLFIVNESGEITDCNKRGYKILDANKRAGIIGKEIAFFIKNNKINWQQLTETERAHEPVLHQIELITLEKRKIWSQCQISAIHFNEQKIYVIQITDITEQKTIKDNQVLQLKNLENNNTELQAILSSTTNDIKTPLITIAYLSELFASDFKDKIGSTGYEQIMNVNQRIKKIQKVVESITVYAKKIKKNKFLQHLNLNDVVNNVIEKYHIPNNITISIQNELPLVNYDNERLELVIFNLIDNAIKFNDKNIGTIIISSSEDEQYWHISITDNGIGIKKNNFDKIFHVFQKLSLEEGDIENHGFGLTLCKKIVETYGGSIWLESELGIGSTFQFTIPKNN